MAAIHHGAGVVENARRLLDAAARLEVPVVRTEQNPKGLGPTVPDLVGVEASVVTKMTFDACRAEGLVETLPEGDVVMAGCEAHVCVLQTALGLVERGRDVYVVADAVGSRHPENKQAALRRLERGGVEIVTTEMVIFEWLETAAHPQFKAVMGLIR